MTRIFPRALVALLVLPVFALCAAPAFADAGANVVTQTQSGAKVRTGVTAHGPIIGNSTTGAAGVTPSSTSGVPLISQGASSDVAFGTAVVAGGGTGVTSVTSGYLLLGNGTSALQSTNQQGQIRQVRGVVTGNISDLTAFTVASNDGLTYAAGQRVLLVGQTTKSQNGPYVVGTVTTGTAPLTRPTDFATGAVVPSGIEFEASEGTLFSNSSWKVTSAVPGGITVGTTNFDLYPRCVVVQATLVAGEATVTTVPILSTSKSFINAARVSSGGTITSTTMYTGTSLTAGVVGTASLTVDALTNAGLTATDDTSTLSVMITNY